MDHPPGEQEIRAAASSKNCELIAVKSTNWPDDSYRTPASYSDAKVVYEAECKPEGGNQAQRVTFEAQFAAVSQEMTGFSKLVWELRLHQPIGQPTAVAKAAEVTAEGAFSDGPECNALMEQVHSQVIPCVEGVDPVAAQRLRSWLDINSQQSRRKGGSMDPAFEAMKIDENCLQSWHTGVARDFGDSSPYKACAPQ